MPMKEVRNKKRKKIIFLATIEGYFSKEPEAYLAVDGAISIDLDSIERVRNQITFLTNYF